MIHDFWPSIPNVASTVLDPKIPRDFDDVSLFFLSIIYAIIFLSFLFFSCEIYIAIFLFFSALFFGRYSCSWSRLRSDYYRHLGGLAADLHNTGKWGNESLQGSR